MFKMLSVSRQLCLFLLFLVQTSFCKLNCDVSPWDTETLRCSSYGEKGNRILNKTRRSHFVDTTLTEEFDKYNWRRIKTFILRDTKLYSLSPDLFTNASELINLDLSGNPDLCFEGGEFLHLKKLQTLRLSGSSKCTQSSLLANVPNLHSLDLSNLKASSTIFSLRNLNSFAGLEIVDLSRNSDIDFTSFNIGGSITSLNASHTTVTLGNKCFENAANLRNLFLSQSGISKIHSNTFEGTALNYLDLSFNSIPANSLLSLTSTMTFVNLSHNKINDLYRSGVFKEELQTLDLSFNNISHLHLDSFADTNKLVTLSLAHNRLFWLYEKLLLGLTNLKTLDLSYNSLSNFHDMFFVDLENLETLNLAGNTFYTLDHSLFQYNLQLKHLYLERNQLHTLNILTFANLKELRTLDLRSNQLKRIPDGLFQIGNLNVLAISCNKLSYIPSNFFKGKYGTHVSLHGNPWKCGCLFPVLNTLHDVDVDQTYLTEGNHPTCYVGKGNYQDCNDNNLSDNDYLTWKMALKESDIKC